jgi:hypothetical protein
VQQEKWMLEEKVGMLFILTIQLYCLLLANNGNVSYALFYYVFNLAIIYYKLCNIFYTWVAGSLLV